MQRIETRPVGWTLTQQECGPYTNGEFDAETHTGHPVQMKAEIGVIHGHAEERQGCRQTPGARERPGKTLSHGLRRTQRCPHLDLSLPASRRGDRTFLMLEPPSLRWLVTVIG